jgi:dihydrofolate reductase
LRNRIVELNREERQMGRIVVTEFVSIDGVMEGPGGDNDFVRGAWSFEFDRGDDGNQFKVDETFGAEAMLLGRNTYEGFANAWPERDGEFADKFNTMPKYVVSSTLADPEWTNTTVLEGDFPDAVRKLRDDSDGDVIVHGSCRLVQGLLANDLVDELRLMIHPVVLGTGLRLWGDTDDALKFKLTDNRSVGPDGVSIQVYERIRD